MKWITAIFVWLTYSAVMMVIGFGIATVMNIRFYGDKMISKELLSEVLGCHIEYVPTQKLIYGTLIFNKNIDFRDEEEINIYELAHKCKEWAWRNSYKIISKYMEGKSQASISHRNNINDRISHWERADTEPEAIFKACEWIKANNDN